MAIYATIIFCLYFIAMLFDFIRNDSLAGMFTMAIVLPVIGRAAGWF